MSIALNLPSQSSVDHMTLSPVFVRDTRGSGSQPGTCSVFLSCLRWSLQVMAQVRSSGPIARTLFERAYEDKKACMVQGDPVGGAWGRLYDALIFSKIKARLGGEVKLMVSGAYLGLCFL